MADTVYVNVAGHRLFDNGVQVEDVTTVGLPNLEHPTTSIEKVSNMVMDVDYPNKARFNACEITVAHNNGKNCRGLCDPGKHNLELRVAREKYVVSEGEGRYVGMKVRGIFVHKATEKGSVEMGNPLGSTERYSVLRYEEEMDGEIVTLVDAMAGIARINGVDVTDEINAILG